MDRRNHPTVTVVATCGHEVTFAAYPDTPGWPLRIAKFRDRPCGPCRMAKELERQRVARAAGAGATPGTGTIRKSDMVKSLPDGAIVRLVKGAGNRWEGELGADGTAVVAEGTGIMGVTSKLVREWHAARGHRVQKT